MDPAYKDQVSRYKPKDGVIAIALWLVVMALYTASGFIGGGGMLSSVVTNLIALAACVILTLARKEWMASIGFRAKNALPSLGLGLICGLAAVVLNKGIVPALILGWPLERLNIILTWAAYYLFSIALTEEVIFRGYIQTRLYGLYKKDIPAVAAGALAFSLMHVPFQLASGNRVLDLSFFIWLATLIILHIAFNLTYVKHNSVLGPILFHALMDLSNELFYRESSPSWSGYIFLWFTICALAALAIRHFVKKRRINAA